MPLICFASQKGSPGASAAALAVAAAFRPGEGRRKLLLEADLAGGALAIRYRLPTEPGLVTLAAAARAGLTDDELWRHACELPGGLPAVVCPDGPEQVHSALAAAGPLLGRHLAERRDVDVIADLGRLQPGSPAVEFAAEATAVLMVARPVAEQLQPAAQRMLALRPRIKNLGWLLVGEKPHGPAEVESTFGFPVVGVLADDRRSVEAIEGGEVTRRVRRHPFVRSAATVAGTLGTWLSPLASAPAPASDEAASDAGTAEAAEPDPAGQVTPPASEPGAVPTSTPDPPAPIAEAPPAPAEAPSGPAEASLPPPADEVVATAQPATGLAADPVSPDAAPAEPEPAPTRPADEPPTDLSDEPDLPSPDPSVRIAADGRAGRPSPQTLGPVPPPLDSAPIAHSNGHARPATAPISTSDPSSPSAASAESSGSAVPEAAASNGAAPAPVDPALVDPVPIDPAPIDRAPAPGGSPMAEPSFAEIDPPVAPAPPLPPPREAERAPVEPDPFVHGDDDVEWTGT